MVSASDLQAGKATVRKERAATPKLKWYYIALKLMWWLMCCN